MNSRDPLFWMWAEACDMLDRADRVQRQFFRVSRNRSGGARWEPPVDVYETGQALWLVIALPGVAAGDVQVSVQEGVLSVIGQRSLPLPAARAAIHRLEIPHGRFVREVRLPPRGYRLESSELRDGCLYVSLAKVT